MNNGLYIRLYLMKVWIVVLVCFLPLGTAAATNTPEGITIFSLNSDFSPLSKSKARMLYKGKVKKLSGNNNFVLLDLPKSSKIRKTFYKNLLGKSISQMNGYWASLSFSGKGVPPEEINNDNIDTVIQWLQSNPDGIAYAPSALVPENANILFTILQGE